MRLTIRNLISVNADPFCMPEVEKDEDIGGISKHRQAYHNGSVD